MRCAAGWPVAPHAPAGLPARARTGPGLGRWDVSGKIAPPTLEGREPSQMTVNASNGATLAEYDFVQVINDPRGV